MSRRFVSEHAGTFPVSRLCKLVGVSRSSYYEWVSRPLSEHDLIDVDLANEIYDIHVASGRTYGAPPGCGPAPQPWPASRLQTRRADHGRVRPGRRARPQEMAARET